MKTYNCLLVLALLTGPATSSAQVNQKEYKLFFEKAYLHTDRETYADGEDIWFKAYLVNGQTDAPALTSNNLYTELISPDAKILDRKVIRIDKGAGAGDFHLPDSVPSGEYRIRAYTSWMKNFGTNFLFEKGIHVYNTVKGDLSGAQQTANKAVNTRAATVSMNSSHGVTLRFFPEGGSLVNGVPAMLAFKAEIPGGKGMALKGNVYGATGQPIMDFSCDSSGMGAFFLNASAGEIYKARGSFANGKTFDLPLPAAVPTGYSLFMAESDAGIKITISTNDATFSQETGKTLILLAKSKGKPIYTSQLKLTSVQSVLNIPKKTFPAGITALTLFDASGKPQCERLFYVQEQDMPALHIRTDKTVYAPKGRVSVTLNLSGPDSIPKTANLSLSAVNASLIPVDEDDIVSYLNLTSEVKGRIENPRQYFDESDPNRAHRLDLLLLTQGWRDFTWKRVADSIPTLHYPVEQGLTVSGTIRQKDKPVAGANVTLTANGAKANKLLFTTTDNDGKFYLDNVQIYGSQAISLTAKDNHLKSPGTLTLDSLFTAPPPLQAISPAAPAIAAASSVPEFIRATTTRKTRFSLSDTLRLKEVKVKTGKTVPVEGLDAPLINFGYKDEVFNITQKDYDHNNLMQYLLHYSAGNTDGDGQLYYIAQGKKVRARMFVNGKYLKFPGQEPYFYSLPLTDVKKVVVKHLLDINQRDRYLIYLTVDPKTVNPSEPNVLAANVTGYYNARTFFTPAYDSPSRAVDLRTTIHWEPNILTNEKGEAVVNFYNADPKAKIRIVAEGVTEKGAPLSATAGYEVK